MILDPFAIIPIFLSLTQGYSHQERSRSVTLAAIAVAVVLSLSALFGEAMLTALGTSLPSFRVAGGIILRQLALAMLRAQANQMRTTSAEKTEAQNRESTANRHLTAAPALQRALPLRS